MGIGYIDLLKMPAVTPAVSFYAGRIVSNYIRKDEHYRSVIRDVEGEMLAISTHCRKF